MVRFMNKITTEVLSMQTIILLRLVEFSKTDSADLQSVPINKKTTILLK